MFHCLYCVSLYPQLQGFSFVGNRIQKIEPSSIPLKIVAAKLHFTDNNLAGSIYLDTQTQTDQKRKPPRKYQLQSLEQAFFYCRDSLGMHMHCSGLEKPNATYVVCIYLDYILWPGKFSISCPASFIRHCFPISSIAQQLKTKSNPTPATHTHSKMTGSDIIRAMAIDDLFSHETFRQL